MGDLASAFFSGGLCGCLMGGLLADRFGYDPVLGLAAVLLLLAASLGSVPLGSVPALGAPGRSAANPLAAGLKTFLTGRSALPLVLLSVAPVSAATVGLVNYFLPLHMDFLGYGPSMTSRLNVLMSLAVIALGPAMGRILDRGASAVGFLAIAGLFAAAAAPVFLVWPALGGAVVAMVLLGLSGVATETGYPAYALGLPETRRLGQREALGLLSLFVRAGQMGGPLLMGAVLGGWGLGGLAALGGALALASVAFYLASGGRASPGGRRSGGGAR